MTQPNVPTEPNVGPDDTDIDLAPPEDAFPALTDPSTLPDDQGDPGHV